MFLLCALSGCNGQNEKQKAIKENATLFEQSIIEKATDYKILSLNEITPFEWDKVYFFPPYASNQYIYEKVGYRWDTIPIATTERMMQIAFMDDEKVVCYIVGEQNLYGFETCYHISSDREEFFKFDNPKFIVNNRSSGPILSWFDESLVDTEQYNDVPETIVGEWGKWVQGSGILDFIITKEGLVNGYLGYGSTEEHGGSGGAQFIGIVNKDIARCKTYPYDEIEFELLFDGNDQFKLFVDFSEKLNFLYIDGEEANIDGEIIVEKID